MSQPLVSVIIPTYNRTYALAELLESLARQTFQDFEVIVVNDNGASVNELKETYSDLSLQMINLKDNRGHVHARNEGIKQASGEYIMLCDDDDLITPKHLEMMVEEVKDADLVYSDVVMVEYHLVGNQRIPSSQVLFAYEFDVDFMRKFSTYVSSGSLYRRRLHEIIGLFDPEVHNYWDWDFILRVIDSHTVKRVPIASVLYAFSSDGDNQSAQLTDKRNQFLEKLCAKHHLGDLPQKNFFTLLEEPEVLARKAESQLVWGEKVVSRIVGHGDR